MALALRGVIEALPGRPWTGAERERMVDFLTEQGFNLYIHAPAAAPLQGHRWREPCLPEEVDRLAGLAERCAAAGVEFAYGLRPADLDAAADLPALWDRLAPLAAVGVHSFLLSLDAAVAVGGDALALANLMGVLLARLGAAVAANPLPRAAAARPLRLLLCPAPGFGAGDDPDLAALGAALDPAIAVCWQGPQRLPAAVTGAQGRRVSAALQRPVLLWDNFLAEPGGGRRHPHLRPLRGREPALHDAVQGIVVAVGPQPELAKIPLHTCAAWCRDPAAYEPELAWEHALLAVSGDLEDASAAGMLGHLARESCLEPALPNPLAPKLAQFWQRWGGAPAAAGPDLPEAPGPGDPAPLGRGLLLERQAAIAGVAREFTRLRWKAERLLGKAVNPRLQAELEPWARKLLAWVEVGELSLELLRLALLDRRDSRLPALREKALARSTAAREEAHAVADDLFDQFCRRCLWAAADPAVTVDA